MKSVWGGWTNANIPANFPHMLFLIPGREDYADSPVFLMLSLHHITSEAMNGQYWKTTFEGKCCKAMKSQEKEELGLNEFIHHIIVEQVKELGYI